ncbi:hypothetical protein NKG05_11780 [Oerskovia sp. M15]
MVFVLARLLTLGVLLGVVVAASDAIEHVLGSSGLPAGCGSCSAPRSWCSV